MTYSAGTIRGLCFDWISPQIQHRGALRGIAKGRLFLANLGRDAVCFVISSSGSEAQLLLDLRLL